jgi:hypothetical protein
MESIWVWSYPRFFLDPSEEINNQEDENKECRLWGHLVILRKALGRKPMPEFGIGFKLK